MANRRQVAVLGLGRFGQAVARELSRLGHDVLAVDNDERTVSQIAADVTHVVQGDITDLETLRSLGLGDFDVVIVGVTDNLGVSIMATVLLRQLGAKRIVAKAADDLHASILRQVGADRAVFPERETGVRVAHSYAAPAVTDYLDVAPGYGIARVPIPVDQAGRTLGELGLRGRNLTPLAVARGATVTLHPNDGDALRAGDALIVAGRDEDLEQLPIQVS